MVERELRARPVRLSETASDGWDSIASAVRLGTPSFTALVEVIGVYLHEHKGRLPGLSVADQRDLIHRTHDIDFERRTRR